MSAIHSREDAGARFTIGDVAGLTGLKPATLRDWERRHEFPLAHRAPDGTRSYRPDQIEALHAVLRMREAGLSLTRAIDTVLAGLAATTPSVHDAVRAACPGIPVFEEDKRTLVERSHLLEDACARAAGASLFLGAFQSPEHWFPSQVRWNRLAAAARGILVIGGYPELVEHVGRAAPVLIPLDHRAALRREWVVVVESSTYRGVLAAREIEQDGDVPDLDRRFEAVLSEDVGAVRAAARVCAGVAAAAGSVLGEQLLEEFAD